MRQGNRHRDLTPQTPDEFSVNHNFGDHPASTTKHARSDRPKLHQMQQRSLREDPQRPIAAANAVAERQPRLEAGDARGVGLLHRYGQQRQERSV
jgi:hypothetical protein